MRWQHPELGWSPRRAFIPVAEQTGLIGPLTGVVLDGALRSAAPWRDAGHDLSVAVNLVRRATCSTATCPAESQRLLASRAAAGARSRSRSPRACHGRPGPRAADRARAAAQLGVQLSIDDFGTGYSSLSMLKRLPVDELKIDRSFVSPMVHDESDMIIVRSTIHLGHDLGMKVIGEGVEDQGRSTGSRRWAAT